MVEIGRKAAIEVNLFIGPRATFDIGAQAYSPAGKALGLSLRGADQLVFAMEDVRRAVGLGLRSVLVSDIGILDLIGQMKSAGELPADLIVKTSVMMAPANPAAAAILETPGRDHDQHSVGPDDPANRRDARRDPGADRFLRGGAGQYRRLHPLLRNSRV